MFNASQLNFKHGQVRKIGAQVNDLVCGICLFKSCLDGVRGSLLFETTYARTYAHLPKHRRNILDLG